MPLIEGIPEAPEIMRAYVEGGMAGATIPILLAALLLVAFLVSLDY